MVSLSVLRLLAARVLFALALLLTVLAVFLPVYSPATTARTEDFIPSLDNLILWRGLPILCYRMSLEGSIYSMQAAAILLVTATTFLLQVSTVWLVRPYHQSRLLCWIARILALICVGYLSYLLIRIRAGLSWGFYFWAAASVLLLIGLLLIPHRRRELAGQGDLLPGSPQ